MNADLSAAFQREQLHRAAGDGDVQLVEDLLRRGYPVNRFDEIGKTPLHYAVEGGHDVVVDRLVRAGANVNAHDSRLVGNTPLSGNVQRCSYAMAKRLIAAGADPTIPGWMGLTAIDRAERRKDADAVKVRQLLAGAARQKQRNERPKR